MDQQFLQDLSTNERIEVLKDNAVRVESYTYPKKLTEEELHNEKSNFVQDQLLINTHDTELKAAKEIHKKAVDPLKKRMGIALNKIRNKAEIVTEDVYLLDDQEEGLMGYYNQYGELVNQRPLLQEERQLRLTTIKNGTNN